MKIIYKPKVNKPIKHSGRTSMYPFATMQQGAMFFIRFTSDDPVERQKQEWRILQAARTFKAKFKNKPEQEQPKFSFKIGTYHDNKFELEPKDGIGCWRD